MPVGESWRRKGLVSTGMRQAHAHIKSIILDRERPSELGIVEQCKHSLPRHLLARSRWLCKSISTILSTE